jgi:hypothetical protein
MDGRAESVGLAGNGGASDGVGVTRREIPAMPAYKCYLLEYRIGAVEVIDCPDDGEASKRADALLAGRPSFHGIEVWERDRRVHVHLMRE